jgi:hypothetical protein
MFCFTVSTIQFDVWILDTCYDNSFMLMILASIYLQLHLYGPIVNKSHQYFNVLEYSSAGNEVKAGLF